MSAGKLFDFLLQLLAPPTCMVCGQRLAPVLGARPAICDSCRAEWERESLAQCPDCLRPFCECRCPPPQMRRAGLCGPVRLLPYGSTPRERAARQVILKNKLHRRRAAVGFCADELAARLRGEPRPDVVTFLPRSSARRLDTGFDQGEELARALAARLDLPCRPLLRRRGGREQKRLDAAGRQRNMRNAFRPAAPCDGLSVLLVDDLVTTGASLARGVEVLLSSGAREVQTAVIAAVRRKPKRASRRRRLRGALRRTPPSTSPH